MASVTEIKYETPPQPRQVRLDSTTRCNGACLSCHRFLSSRKGEMNIDLITQVLDDISRWQRPLEEMVAVNYGELFMRKDWYLILSMIAQKLPATQIVIPTNGALLDEDAVFKLCKIPTLRLINLSINAYFDETYEMFNGLPASNIPRLRKAVAQFKLLRPDLQLRASMVFDPEWQTDLERDLFIDYWVGWAKPSVSVAASAGRPGKKSYQPVKIPCRSIFSDFVIGFDGKLNTCCFDANMDLDLGYYSGDILKDWRNEKFETFRRLHNDHRRDEIDLCRACTFS